MSAAMMRRIVMDTRKVTMVTRRRRWAPGINDDVLHHDRVFLWLHAVAMAANCRAVSMRNNPSPVADRTEGSVDVIAVNPRSRRRTTGSKGYYCRRENCQDVLVHITPHFPFYNKLGKCEQKKLTILFTSSP